MDKVWLVIYRRAWTQTVTKPADWFATQKQAEAAARDFNHYSQDATWNAEVAVVHNTREPLRA